MIQKIIELRDNMEELSKDLDELSVDSKQKVLDQIENLQKVVLYLLEDPIKYNISDKNILEMLRDTLNALEQEDAVLLQDVIKFGWVSLFTKIENITKNGENL